MLKQKLIDNETAEWILDGLTWLSQNNPRQIPWHFWMPIAEDFGHEKGAGVRLQGHALADFLARRLSAQMGLAHLNIDLVQTKGANPKDLGGLMMLQPTENAALGTYMARSYHNVRIEYDVSQLEDIPQLIATLAHELSHHIVHCQPLPEWMDPELEEHFTDLTAVYFGYGVFLANGRLTYQQYQDHDRIGWSSGVAGYLGETQLAFAMSAMMFPSHQSDMCLKPHLKKHIYKMVRKGQKQICDHTRFLEIANSMSPT